jgi:hypothetical protein
MFGWISSLMGPRRLRQPSLSEYRSNFPLEGSLQLIRPNIEEIRECRRLHKKIYTVMHQVIGGPLFLPFFASPSLSASIKTITAPSNHTDMVMDEDLKDEVALRLPPQMGPPSDETPPILSSHGAADILRRSLGLLLMNSGFEGSSCVFKVCISLLTLLVCRNLPGGH